LYDSEDPIPINTIRSSSKKRPATTYWRSLKAALTMVNGGEPVMARNPARRAAPESGMRVNAPRTWSVDLLP
jgi:hypothetical protein